MFPKAQDTSDAYSVRVLFPQISVSLFGLFACWLYFSVNLVCILKPGHSLMYLPPFPPQTFYILTSKEFVLLVNYVFRYTEAG